MRHHSPFGCVALMAVALALAGSPEHVLAAVYNADPSNYRSYLALLQPGDTLNLSATAGTYIDGLPLNNLNGTATAPIIIQGPASPRATFNARSCCNTVSIVNSSHVEIHNLELNGKPSKKSIAVDAVKAEGTGQFAHHITLENLYIHDHNSNQQIVGISTKCPAWNWVIRNNIIESTGTGIYLGDSDGTQEFVNGIIEGNLVADTIGYNMQIKHQLVRNTSLGEPASGVTIIRNNVFSKATNASKGPNARPNVLVGHWPLSGDGANDHYLIYGNFFHQNGVGQALFQGEGNVALYDNLFYNSLGTGPVDGIAIQPHNDVPKDIRIFGNTVVARNIGISVTGGAAGYTEKVIGNAVFAVTPIAAADQADNITAAYSQAGSYLNNPTAPLGSGLDLYPKVGTLKGAPIDTSSFTAFQDYNLDFNYKSQDFLFHGAYDGEGANPGWVLQRARKPLP